jgi:hypothetical protein
MSAAAWYRAILIGLSSLAVMALAVTIYAGLVTLYM